MLGAMELFYKILKTAVEGGASDVHIKIATPIILRINGELIAWSEFEVMQKRVAVRLTELA